MGNAPVKIPDVLIEFLLYFFTGNRVGQVAAYKFTKIFRLCKRRWAVHLFFLLLFCLILLLPGCFLLLGNGAFQLHNALLLLSYTLSQLEDSVLKIFQQYKKS